MQITHRRNEADTHPCALPAFAEALHTPDRGHDSHPAKSGAAPPYYQSYSGRGFLFLFAAGFFGGFSGGAVLSGPVFLEQSFEFGDGGGMAGIVDQVFVFLRIGLIVVELSALVAVVPFGVTVASGAYTVAGELAAPDLRESGPVPFRRRIIEERPETDAGKIFRRREAAQISEGRIKVHKLYGALAGFAVAAGSGRDDDQRDAGGVLKEALLHPKAMFTEMVAVVAPEHDDRIVPKFEPAHGVNEAPDLRVHEGDGGVIGLLAFAGLIPGDTEPGPGRGAGQGGFRNVLQVIGGLFGKADAVERIEIEIFGGRNPGAMRFVKARGNEKRFVLVLLKLLNGFGGDFAVRVFLVFSIFV